MDISKGDDSNKDGNENGGSDTIDEYDIAEEEDNTRNEGNNLDEVEENNKEQDNNEVLITKFGKRFAQKKTKFKAKGALGSRRW